MRLSLCVIARNEEAFLSDCLKSVRGLADELIVVDTGSQDATREVARQAKAFVFESPWRQDFSQARNEALSHAHGKWVLILDADERLDRASIQVLRRVLDEDDFDCGFLKLHNASRVNASAEEVLAGKARLSNPSWLPRLLRRTPDLRYQGLVHENVEEWLSKAGRRKRLLPADIIHFGAIPELRQQRQKTERNIQLLRRQHQMAPDDIVSASYLALELLNAGQTAEARAVVERAWPHFDAAHRLQSGLRLAVARGLIGIQSGEAQCVLEAVHRAEALVGQHPDLYFLHGCALELLALRAHQDSRRTRDLLEGAIKAYDQALSEGGHPELGQFVLGATGWSAQLRKGTALLLSSRPEEARRCFELALMERPDNREAKLGEAEAILEGGDSAQALARLEPLLGPEPDGWLLAAASAKQLGATGEASLLLTRALERNKEGYLATHRQLRQSALMEQLPH